MPLRYIELFAGVGGLSLGLDRAGFQCVAHAEIDRFARRVLAARWPDVPLLGDVREIDGGELVRRYGPIDLLSGGSPCQDLSVAGNRAGLEGERSGLFYEQVRVWREVLAAQESDCLLLWENVDGARSVNEGADFGVVLSSVVGAPIAVPPDGWRTGGVAAGASGVAAWRVLDAQYLGVPQRRARVFVLGTRTGSIDPAEVLAVTEGLPRHPRARRQASKDDPAAARARAARPGEPEVGQLALAFDGLNHASADVHASLRTNRDAGDFVLAWGPEGVGAEVADPISANEASTYTHEGTGNFRLHNVVMQPASEPAPFDLAQITNPENRARVDAGAPAPTLNGSGQAHAVVSGESFAFKPSHFTRDKDGGPSEVMPPLTADADKGDQDAVIFQEPSAEVQGALCASMARSRGSGEEPAALVVQPTLQAHHFRHASEDPQRLVVQASARDPLAEHTDALAPTLGARDYKGPGNFQNGSLQATAVIAGLPRRLLPLECERLQAWPDGWTDVPDETGRPAADSPRYRVAGNGVCSVHSEWVAWQLRAHLEL